MRTIFFFNITQKNNTQHSASPMFAIHTDHTRKYFLVLFFYSCSF